MTKEDCIDYNKTIGELLSEITCDCGRCMKCNVRYCLLFEHKKKTDEDDSKENEK